MSCGDGLPTFNIESIKGYAPVYAESIEPIAITEPQNIVFPGNVYTYKNLILINEKNRGYHILDNSDKSNPNKIGFISIPFNKDISIKDDVIYANSGADLVSMSINQDTITSIKRFENVFKYIVDEAHPPFSSQYRYFECVNPKLGAVMGWELKTIKNPQCYY